MTTPYDHGRNVYRPESLDRLRQTRGLDQLHAGPVGREHAAFRAAVHSAQLAQHPQSGTVAQAPGGYPIPASEATVTSAPVPASPQTGGGRRG